MEEERKSRATVQIFGDLYPIVADESIEHIRRVADIVDGKMLEMKKRFPQLSTKQIAVLAAVNLTSDYLKGMEEAGLLKNQKEEE